MANKLTKEQRDEALAKVAEVLEEAMAEYEALEKMDLEMAEDPTRPIAAAPAEEEAEDKDEDKEKEDEDSDEEADEDKDKEDEDKEDEMSDDTLKSEYAALAAKMEQRGLLKKSEEAAPAKTEAKAEEVKKSEEAAPAPQADKTEDLKKSFDEQFSALTKAVSEIAEKVNKIASAPAPRKGLSGVQPLKKNDETTEEQPLNKAEVVDKLLELKKSGKHIPTDLFMRIETGRHTNNDLKFIKGILG